MIFGVAKAIAREQAAIHQYHSVVMDLSDVPLIDTTISLAIENAIEYAVDAKREVFIVSKSDETKETLERLGVFELIPTDHITSDRTEALRRAAELC